jgi:hypothetical protein
MAVVLVVPGAMLVTLASFAVATIAHPVKLPFVLA